MEFTDEFTVPTGAGQAWSVLTDVPRIAPCLPGATVEPHDENSYAGTVAVKVGPIRVSYSGIATFAERDRDALRLVLEAQGKEQSGKGSASATVTVRLAEESADRTRVHVHTELRITGKLAQFGRSAMADVSSRLIAQFAANLENLLGPAPAGEPQAGATVPATPPTMPRAGDRELDALTMVAPLLKRALPGIGAFASGVLLTWLTGRLRRTRDRRILGLLARAESGPGQYWPSGSSPLR
ncbi:SRPBCC family protein [Sciscionella sediminilitoris]|uniref:SRPBCC family protein n=1 Tax=Sciscionella sediminilitoris TaxID=1445613 RepID=UPI00055CABDA|nr:SRPBCC family protein [Sciscionella sp. SE31]